ncbi:MAG: hypothetical protein LBU80_01645 [Rikenellaceae bacterium]|jgi:hypothetical protein|nr:hypothetical protein [Rikenellaceae bacterium]
MTTRFIKKNILYLVGGAAGGVGGYLHYHFIGCTGGSCPIASSPVMSVVWGVVMGGLLLGMFKREEKRDE